MDLLVRALLTYLLHSTLLLGAAALVRFALRGRRLALQEAVLRAALVGGFLTAGLQLGLGLHPLAGAIRVPGAVRATASPAWPVSDGRPAAAPASRPLAPRWRMRAALAPAGPAWLGDDVARATSHARDAVAGAGAAALARWPLALVAGWAALGALALARLAVAARRLACMLRGRRPIRDGELAPESVALICALGLWPRVRLSAAPRLAVPLATGVLRPEVCLPPRAVFELGVDEQVALCAHELAHLARRDPAWILLARVVECLAPLQPLNTWARRRLQDLAELLSDDLAVSVSARPLGLARSLVDVAAWAFGEPPLVPAAAAGALSARSRLGQRVERLMDPLRDIERPRRFLLPLAACVVLASSLVTPVVLGSAAPQEHAAPQADATPQADPAPRPAQAPLAQETPHARPAAHAPHAAPMPRAEAAGDAEPAVEQRLEELARQIEARAHAHDADLRRIEAEIEAVASRFQPNDAELEKLSSEIEASAAELATAVAAGLDPAAAAGSDGHAKAAARRMAELQAEIQAVAGRMRPPDAQLRALTEKARALADQARPTEAERREIHELSDRIAHDAARQARQASEQASQVREAMRRAAGEMRRAADELRARAEAEQDAATPDAAGAKQPPRP